MCQQPSGVIALGVPPALLIVYVQIFVKEPPVWVDNQRLQRTQHREVRTPLFSIFKRGLLGNTLTGCWMMAGAIVVGYSIGGLFPTYLLRDLHLTPGHMALPVLLQSLMFFLSGSLRGWFADRVGRRWAIMIPPILTHTGGAALSTDDELHDDRHLLYDARRIRRRRHARPVLGLFIRASSRLRCGQPRAASSTTRVRSSAAW